MKFEKGDRVAIEGVVVQAPPNSSFVDVLFDGWRDFSTLTCDSLRLVRRRPLKVGDPVRSGAVRGQVTALEPEGAFAIVLDDIGNRRLFPTARLERDEQTGAAPAKETT